MSLIFFFNYIKYPLNTVVRLAVKYMLILIFPLLQSFLQTFPCLRLYYTVAIHNNCSLHHTANCRECSDHFTIMHTAQSSLDCHAHSPVITWLSCTERSHHFTILHNTSSPLLSLHNSTWASCLLRVSVSILHIFHFYRTYHSLIYWIVRERLWQFKLVQGYLQSFRTLQAYEKWK